MMNFCVYTHKWYPHFIWNHWGQPGKAQLCLLHRFVVPLSCRMRINLSFFLASEVLLLIYWAKYYSSSGVERECFSSWSNLPNLPFPPSPIYACVAMCSCYVPVGLKPVHLQLWQLSCPPTHSWVRGHYVIVQGARLTAIAPYWIGLLTVLCVFNMNMHEWLHFMLIVL